MPIEQKKLRDLNLQDFLALKADSEINVIGIDPMVEANSHL